MTWFFLCQIAYIVCNFFCVFFSWIANVMDRFLANMNIAKNEKKNLFSHPLLVDFHYRIFLKSAPRAFEIEIKLGFLTLQLATPLYCRWTVIQSIFFMKGYQNAKFDSKWRYSLHISVWKSLKLAHCVVLYHHFTQYFCSNLFWKV